MQAVTFIIVYSLAADSIALSSTTNGSNYAAVGSQGERFPITDESRSITTPGKSLHESSASNKMPPTKFDGTKPISDL